MRVGMTPLADTSSTFTPSDPAASALSPALRDMFSRALDPSPPPPHPSYPPHRTLEFRRGNLFACTDAWSADIIIMETLIPADCFEQLAWFLSGIKKGAKLLTFGEIRGLWRNENERHREGSTTQAQQRQTAPRINTQQPSTQASTSPAADPVSSQHTPAAHEAMHYTPCMPCMTYGCCK